MPDLIPTSLDLTMLEERAAATRAKLNARRSLFVDAVVAGKTYLAAAEAAGYARGHRYSSHLAAKPAVRAAIAAAKALAAAKAGYTAAQMMAELDAAMEHARATENSSALVRAIELKGRLTGILVDRLDARIAVGAFVMNVSGLGGDRG